MKFLIPALVLLSSIGFAQEKTQLSYLVDMGLNLDHIKERYINNENCTSDKDKFKACIYSYGIILDNYSDGQKVLTSPDIKDRLIKKNIGELYKKVDGNSLIYNRLENDDEKVTNDLRKRLVRRWGDLAVDKHISPDFDNLMDFLREDLVIQIAKMDLDDFEKAERVDVTEAYLSKLAMDGYFQYMFGDHSRVESSEYSNLRMNTSSHEIKGVMGIIGKLDKDSFLVYEVYEGGPSSDILKPFDKITHYDGVAVSDPEVKMGGSVGDVKKLTVLRGEKELNVEITLGKIVQNNVESKLVDDGEIKIGYILFRSFISGSAFAVASAAINLQQDGAQVLILDLRNNGGGYVGEAISLADVFLEKGSRTMGVQDFASGKGIVESYANFHQLVDLPMVTLINSSSASASEILSGALVDNGRTILVGKRSFGKGTMQSVKGYEYKEFEDQLDMIKNVARFYRPGIKKGAGESKMTSTQLKGIDVHFDVDVKVPYGLDEIEEHDREADMAVFPIPADGKTVKYRASAGLKRCVRRNGRADKLFMSDDIYRSHDFQLLYAEDVASCLKLLDGKKVSKLVRFSR